MSFMAFSVWVRVETDDPVRRVRSGACRLCSEPTAPPDSPPSKYWRIRGESASNGRQSPGIDEIGRFEPLGEGREEPADRRARFLLVGTGDDGVEAHGRAELEQRGRLCLCGIDGGAKRAHGLRSVVCPQ